MKLAAVTLLLIALIVLPARAQVLCAPHTQVVQYLAKTYAERPVGVGVATSGKLVEVFASKVGTWTIVTTAPGGPSCIRVWGEGWIELDDSTVTEEQIS
jgi:hypothetical protein